MQCGATPGSVVLRKVTERSACPAANMSAQRRSALITKGFDCPSLAGSWAAAKLPTVMTRRILMGWSAYCRHSSGSAGKMSSETSRKRGPASKR
eukprot:1225459-Prymnesium_polylepis.3